MPQLNILVSEHLMKALEREAKELGVKKTALVRSKLGRSAIALDRGESEPAPVRTPPKPLVWSTAPQPQPTAWSTVAQDVAEFGPYAEPAFGTTVTVPTALQLSTKTGLPFATCVRYLVTNRVTVDDKNVMIDGEPI